MDEVVYTVDAKHYADGSPEVVAVALKRETAKMYFVERSRYVGYAASVTKESETLFKTPLEAAQAYLKRCRMHTDVARSTLDKFRQDEQRAETLLAEMELGRLTPPPHDTT